MEKKLKRNLIISLILLGATIGRLIAQNLDFHNLRTVDVVSIFAAGVLLGVSLTQGFMLMRSQRGKSI